MFNEKRHYCLWMEREREREREAIKAFVIRLSRHILAMASLFRHGTKPNTLIFLFANEFRMHNLDSYSKINNELPP